MKEWWAAINFSRPRKKRKGRKRHLAKLLGADNGKLGAETGQRIVQSWGGGGGEKGSSVNKRLDEKITRQELERKKLIRALQIKNKR